MNVSNKSRFKKKENYDNRGRSRNRMKLQQIEQFCFFGSTIMKDNCCIAEIKRIVLGKQALQKNNILIDKHEYFSIEPRIPFKKNIYMEYYSGL